jgi:hypothetical protein
MAIEKIKILGAVLELPAKQHCQFSPFGPIFEVNGLDWQCYLGFFGEWKNSCSSKFVQLELLNKAKARSSKNLQLKVSLHNFMHLKFF